MELAMTCDAFVHETQRPLALRRRHVHDAADESCDPYSDVPSYIDIRIIDTSIVPVDNHHDAVCAHECGETTCESDLDPRVASPDETHSMRHDAAVACALSDDDAAAEALWASAPPRCSSVPRRLADRDIEKGFTDARTRRTTSNASDDDVGQELISSVVCEAYASSSDDEREPPEQWMSASAPADLSVAHVRCPGTSDSDSGTERSDHVLGTLHSDGDDDGAAYEAGSLSPWCTICYGAEALRATPCCGKRMCVACAQACATRFARCPYCTYTWTT